MKSLSLFLIFLCLFDLKCVRIFEIIWAPENDTPEERLKTLPVKELTGAESNEFIAILSDIEKLKSIDDTKKKNVVFYQLFFQGNGETHEIKLNNDTLLFLSGGDRELSKKLAEETGGFKVQCIANYFPPEKANDSTYLLRKAIAESFEFNEAQPGFSTRMRKEFEKQVIKSMEEFKEVMVLGPKVISTLAGTFQDTLEYRVFDEKSTKKANDLGLIDKRKKGEPLSDISQLFDGSVQLQFGDSEQAMKMQILEGLRHYTFPHKVDRTYLDEISSTEGGDYWSSIWDLYMRKDREITLNDFEELVKVEESFIPQILDFLYKSGVRATLKVFSIHDMCRNCQATFEYDFEKLKKLNGALLKSFFNSFNPRLDQNFLKCLNGWGYGGSLSGLKLDIPIILQVISLEEY